MAMKQFDKRIKDEKFKPVFDLTYAPFDPELMIGGSKMAFILDPSVHNTDLPFKAAFMKSHFKFLGRWIHYFVKEDDIQKLVSTKFEADMDNIDKSLVHGFMKAWLYQFYVLSRLSWLFLVHDLNRSLAETLTRQATAKLKKWCKIAKTADQGLLYRSKEDFGLGLTPISIHFEKMQLVKCCLLQNSVSEDIRALYEAKMKKEAPQGKRWKSTKHATMVAASYNLKKMFPSQHSKQGLGFGNYKAVETLAERRKGMSNEATLISGEKYLQHTHSLKMQSVWTQWSKHTTPFDFSWKSLLYKHSPQLVKFVLHASINWVKTPDLLKVWKLKETAQCGLCSVKQCTLHHILSNCQFALKDKRYTWRHDSVLQVFQSTLTEHVNQTNKSPASRSTLPPLSKSFVSPGETRTNSPHRPSLLVGGGEWELQVDKDSSLIFPPEIFATNQRPDVVIWSTKLKKVFLIELTCPAEEGISNANTRKKVRYNNLTEMINSQTKWKASLFSVEVGVRGFVADSTRFCMKSLGLKPAKIRNFIKKVSEVSARCSYAIYLASSDKAWPQNRSLLEVDEPRCMTAQVDVGSPRIAAQRFQAKVAAQGNEPPQVNVGGPPTAGVGRAIENASKLAGALFKRPRMNHVGSLPGVPGDNIPAKSALATKTVRWRDPISEQRG